MNKEEFINFLETKSVSVLKLKRDSYGNYKGTTKSGNIVRYKLQKNSVRYEKQIKFADKNEWRKIWSEYYKNLEVNPETGMLRRIKK